MEAQQTIVHGGICGPHMNGHMLAKKLLGMGYYWSTMESDCTELCQIDANKINAPPNELHKLTTPWPFAVLAWMDLLFPLPQKTSKETNCVIVAIDYFTKWVGWRQHQLPMLPQRTRCSDSFRRTSSVGPHEIIKDHGTHFKKKGFMRKVQDSAPMVPLLTVPRPMERLKQPIKIGSRSWLGEDVIELFRMARDVAICKKGERRFEKLGQLHIRLCTGWKPLYQ